MKLRLSALILVIFAGVFYFGGAKSADAACNVIQANFRTSPPLNAGNANSWFSDANPPYVYIDFTTTGCQAGQDTFQLSITELDDENGLNNANDDDISAADNRNIQVPGDSFTFAFRAGEDECENVTTHPFDCMYYIRINDSVLGGANNINQTQHLFYECNTSCDENWQFFSAHLPHGGSHPDDNFGSSGGNQQGGGGALAPGTQVININISNPITSNTIPEFIQKVLDFALTVGIPLVAIAIIYSGFLFVTARGNDKQLETAKNAFTYAVIGGAILLGCFIFAQLIKDTIETIGMIFSHFA